MSSVLVVACERTDKPGAGNEMALREVAALTGTSVKDWRLAHQCRECGSSTHGRPLVLRHGALRDREPGAGPVHVSVSRAGGLVLVAVTDAGSVGIDLEPDGAVGRTTYADVARHVLEDAGSDPTVAWVRKESVVKAVGRGLALDPRTLRVSGSSAAPELLAWPAGAAGPGPLVMLDLDVADGFVAAVAVVAPQRPTLVVRRAEAATRAV